MPLFNLLQGMDAIERLEPGGFTEYLKNSKNTICGRHPIGVLLNVSVFFLKKKITEKYCSLSLGDLISSAPVKMFYGSRQDNQSSMQQRPLFLWFL